MQFCWVRVFYPYVHICFLFVDVFFAYYLSLLARKWRWKVFLVLYFFETIIIWINVGYSRYFNTYLPLTLYGEFNNLNGLLPNILDAIEISDFLFLLTSIIVYVAVKRLMSIQKSKGGLIVPCLSVVIFLFSFMPFLHSAIIERDRLHDHFVEMNDNRSIWDVIRYWIQITKQSDIKAGCFYYGIHLSLFYDLYEKLINRNELVFSETEIRHIKSHLYSTPYKYPTNGKKNIILIIVESLSSFPINKTIDGIQITPNINKLLSESYFNPNMESQTLLGESSDGQFIYLTGLLPLENCITINEIQSDAVTSFITLSKKGLNNCSTNMIIPTSADNWSQRTMCYKYGIDNLFSQEQYKKEKEEWLNDKQLFEYASSIDNGISTNSPFINIILTSSMHSPYTKSMESYGINYPTNYSSEFKHYLDNVHYMDKYLGEYIKSLKQKKLFEESTIIIVADHKPNKHKLNCNGVKGCTLLPLIIINPSSQYKGIIDMRPIEQTCLFPTILDILGVKSKWRGIGQSVFMPDSIRLLPYEIERKNNNQKISQYILYKNYL